MSRRERNSPRLARAAAACALVSAVMSCAPAQPGTGPAMIPDLSGRTAGTPLRCVPMQQTDALRIVDSQTVLYGSGRTIWVNRLGSECPGMHPMGILIVEPSGSQYCRGDRVRPVDPVGKIPGPACALGDFVPYSR